jgi:hypothetical protein
VGDADVKRGFVLLACHPHRNLSTADPSSTRASPPPPQLRLLCHGPAAAGAAADDAGAARGSDGGEAGGGAGGASAAAPAAGPGPAPPAPAGGGRCYPHLVSLDLTGSCMAPGLVIHVEALQAATPNLESLSLDGVGGLWGGLRGIRGLSGEVLQGRSVWRAPCL